MPASRANVYTLTFDNVISSAHFITHAHPHIGANSYIFCHTFRRESRAIYNPFLPCQRLAGEWEKKSSTCVLHSLVLCRSCLYIHLWRVCIPIHTRARTLLLYTVWKVSKWPSETCETRRRLVVRVVWLWFYMPGEVLQVRWTPRIESSCQAEARV